MTTERGPGVPDELRERLADVIGGEFDGPGRPDLAADAVLAEIAAAGFEIVASDRLERLQETASAAKEFTDTLFLVSGLSNEQAAMIARDLGVLIAEAVLRLRPGDLDAGESEAGR